MSVKIKLYEDAIKTRIKSGTELATIAVTEAVVEYGNIFVREDQGTLKDSALIKSQPKKGLAIWDTDYAKSVLYWNSFKRCKCQCFINVGAKGNRYS